MIDKNRTRASRAAIEKLYVSMRHLFNRGSYKPMGISGSGMVDALLELQPEIYGDLNHPTKVEIDGLVYVIDRLPIGIERCCIIKLIGKEGYREAGFDVIVPPKRRRNCFRIDENRMYIEMTRGRSDIYDILTHLSFIYLESLKVKRNALDTKGELSEDWKSMKEVMKRYYAGDHEAIKTKRALTYLSNLMGRTIEETTKAVDLFENSASKVSLFVIIYHLGKLALREHFKEEFREISFSPNLRKTVGNHTYGEEWANNIKNCLTEKGLLTRPLHIISANLHSIKNTLFAQNIALDKKELSLEELITQMVANGQNEMQQAIDDFAKAHGMFEIQDSSGTNLNVQVFDISKIKNVDLAQWIPNDFKAKSEKDQPVILVMDYAFGEQAFECMDELLKPYENIEGEVINLNVETVSVMGKAGILKGGKGDIMVPTAHVFEGTADNYPIENLITKEELDHEGLKVYDGTMITVLGTSLQNKAVLEHFFTSSWNAIGLEMEGAHYQKAIQSASMIRKSIKKDVKVMYAYYASDNPLVTGATLAHGSLGYEGVVSTYLISKKIIQKILKH